ncbi:MAG: Clp protease N-terminal domain-containing protein, partial [Solirubrobacteraceae bacterium]
VDPDSTACQVLNSSGVTLDGARERLLGIVGRGDSEYPASGYIPFTARAEVVLERSLAEALNLGHQTVTPEHLLLGLTGEDEGVVIDILVDCGTSRTTIRERLLPMLSERDP